MPRLLPLTLLLLLACAKTPAANGDTSSSTGAATATSASSATSVDSACPSDLLAARGTACAPEGKACRAGPGSFTHLLMCSRGKWTEMDAPPPPPPPPAKS